MDVVWPALSAVHGLAHPCKYNSSEIFQKAMDHYYMTEMMASHSLFSPANCSKELHRQSCSLEEDEVWNDSLH